MGRKATCLLQHGWPLQVCLQSRHDSCAGVGGCGGKAKSRDFTALVTWEMPSIVSGSQKMKGKKKVQASASEALPQETISRHARFALAPTRGCSHSSATSRS